MGQARRRKLSGTYPADRKLKLVGVGFGGLCGSCDEIHGPDPNPFIYTVGLTDEDQPELLLIVPGADRQDIAQHHDLMSRLATLQRRRGKAFEAPLPVGIIWTRYPDRWAPPTSATADTATGSCRCCYGTAPHDEPR